MLALNHYSVRNLNFNKRPNSILLKGTCGFKIPEVQSVTLEPGDSHTWPEENVKFEGGGALFSVIFVFGDRDKYLSKKVEAWIEKLMGCELLPETEIISLCKKAKEVFNQVAIISKSQIRGYRHLFNIVVNLQLALLSTVDFVGNL